MNDFEYDVALSLAGEDRAYVRAVANALEAKGLRVFFDEFKSVEMWGEDLYTYLDEIFRKKARYAIPFISRHYVEKAWPRHEVKSAQARALEARASYLLPVRLDDTELPGLPPTIGYVDARIVGQERLIEMAIEKVSDRPTLTSIERVPRSLDGEALLLASRPDAWEYLYYACVLLREREAHEQSYRDFRIGYAVPSGALDEDEADALINGAMAEVLAIVANVDRILTEETQTQAFGAPRESGDPDLIEHFAKRLIAVYAQLLGWWARVRGAAVPQDYESTVEALSRFAAGPIEQIRRFVDDFVVEADTFVERMRAGEQIQLTMTVKLSVEEGASERFRNELELLRQKQLRGFGS